MGCVSKVFFLFLLLVVALVCLLGTYEGRFQTFKISAKLNLEGTVSSNAAGIIQKLVIGSTILGCGGDYAVCGRAEIGMFMSRLVGSDSGYGPGIGDYNIAVVNHEAYVDKIYDPNLGRSPEIFVGAKLDSIFDGIIPKNTLLNLGTADPEHTKRRSLISETLPGLRRHPSRDFLVPDWMGEATPDENTIYKLVGLNLFKWLFDVELENMHLDMLMEFNSVTGPIALGILKGDAEQAASISAIYKQIEAVIAASDIGKAFLAKAAERDMSPEVRLHELSAILMFAGFGGTSLYSSLVVNRIASDPGLYVPMYQADKAAFLKECARLTPPVGGLIVTVPESGSATLGGELKGKVLKWEEDSTAVMWIPSANKDPAVFGGPDKSQAYAFEFDPTRDNLDQIMTWNGKLDDIERGVAPRACPGAILAIQMAEKLVDHFLPLIQAGAANAADEL